MLKIYSIEDSYRYALSTKDKLKRRHQGNSQGKENKEHFVKDKLVDEDEKKPIE